MTAPNLTNDVFRFVHVRQPKPVSKKDEVIDLTNLDGKSCDATLQEILSKGSREDALEWAKVFHESNDFVTDLSQLPLPFAYFLHWLHDNQEPSQKEIGDKIVDVFGVDAATLIQVDEFKKSCARLSCSYIAITLLSRGDENDYRKQRQERVKYLIDGLEVCKIIKTNAESKQDEEKTVVNLRRRTVLFPSSMARMFQSNAQPIEEDSHDADKVEEKRTAVQQKITAIKSVIDELSFAWRFDNGDKKENSSKTKGQTDKKEGLSRQNESDTFSRYISNIKPKKLKKLLDDPDTRPFLLNFMQNSQQDDDLGDDLLTQLEQNPDVLSKTAFDNLTPLVKETLDNTHLDLKTMGIPFIVNQLEKQLIQESSNLPQPRLNKPLMLAIGGSIVSQLLPLDSIPGLSHLGKHWWGQLNVLGIGDLKVVRETLMRFEAGEIAHIENILQGEFKERFHRRARLIEETFEEESETTETNERDLQTSERFELQSATSQQLHIEASAEGDASVSASYGPTVGVEANTAFSGGTSTDLANSNATTFAREVINRSVHRLQERTRTLHKRRTVNEFEETNRHGINNEKGEKHITGIYQFVNKVLCAQVYNYGKRLLIEFLLPQPGKHLLEHAANVANQSATALEQPETFSLDPTELQPANFDIYVKKYRVTGVDAPPEKYRTVSHVIKFEVESGLFKAGLSHFSSDAKDVDIPVGYKAIKGHARFAYPALPYYDVTKQEVQNTLPEFMKLATGDRWWPELVRCAVTMAVGRKIFKLKYREHSRDTNSNDFNLSETFDLYDETVKIPIAATATHKTNLAVSVEIKCERTDEAFMQWQLDTHEKIMQGYFTMKSEYEEKLAAAAIQQGIIASGRNPELNRKIEHDELKRQATNLLWSQMMMVPAGLYPDLIMFTENAFEWENMSYKLFSYFWAEFDQWDTLLQLQDNDPIHMQFLQAGATRLVLPVRNEFAAQALNFLTTASIWSDVTELTDPGHLEILEELRGAPDNPNGVPEDPSWEVKVPTPLVILKGGDDLPIFLDDCHGAGQ